MLPGDGGAAAEELARRFLDTRSGPPASWAAALNVWGLSVGLGREGRHALKAAVQRLLDDAVAGSGAATWEGP